MLLEYQRRVTISLANTALFVLSTAAEMPSRVNQTFFDTTLQSIYAKICSHVGGAAVRELAGLFQGKINEITTSGEFMICRRLKDD
jgi:hypothetical protein